MSLANKDTHLLGVNSCYSVSYKSYVLPSPTVTSVFVEIMSHDSCVPLMLIGNRSVKVGFKRRGEAREVLAAVAKVK